MTLGIGCIIGAGIFVLTGHAAATMAGPAVIYAFIISGLACAFAGLRGYAELASTMPVSGSAYSYSYVTLGEVFAWTMGWLLLLEYGIAASTVAAGWTGYVVSLAKDFGIVIADAVSHSTMQYIVPDPNNPAAHQGKVQPRSSNSTPKTTLPQPERSSFCHLFKRVDSSKGKPSPTLYMKWSHTFQRNLPSLTQPQLLASITGFAHLKLHSHR